MNELQGLKGVSAWLVYNKVVFSMVFLRRFNMAHNDQLTRIDNLQQCETLEEFQAAAEQLNTDKFEALFYSQEECVQMFKGAGASEQRKMLLEALTITALSDDEVLRLISCHRDSNGVPFSRVNIKNMLMGDIVPLLLETLVYCAGLDCDLSLLDESDFELIKGKRVSINDELNDTLTTSPEIETGNVLALALKRVLSRFKGNDNT